MVKKALIFPGQGSQSKGMLYDLANKFSIIKDVFNEASDSVSFDIWKLVQDDPDNQLNQTEFTQVAMLTADVSVFKLLQQQGLSDISMMAGHSLGEFAALVCSEAISLTEAVPLVLKRGQCMQQAVPIGLGAMAAIIGLNDEDIIHICQLASIDNEQVSPANFNALGQVVIAGHMNAVNRAMELSLEKNAKMAKIIPVSVPCHCSLLHKASEKFAEYLEEIDFKSPNVPVISNVDLSIYKTPQEIRNRLKEQLYSPVRWVEIIQMMSKNGIEILIESGPGKVLTGLTNQLTIMRLKSN